LKLTIKVRHKIVADGLNDETFDVTNKGVHLKAQEFNNMLEDPNTIVVDFRNHYESEVGILKALLLRMWKTSEKVCRSSTSNYRILKKIKTF
jgi:predicted sulfurtransferase